MNLTTENKKDLLKIARISIEEAVNNKSFGCSPPSKESVLANKAGAFVTLKKNGNLRGCIGFTEAHFPLYETVTQAAQSAATKDYRFPQVEKNELKEIEIEISVLSPLEIVNKLEDIKIGRDGLMIEQGVHRGLLLPQVATEYNLSRDEFLKHTCLKAGLPEEAYLDPQTKIWSFHVILFSESELNKKD